MTPDPLDALRAALAGRYRLVREIARGGMAAVHLVHDLKHDRQVALKIMHASIAGSEVDRFLREIGVTARFTHPHILPLLDSGEALGLPYYVMPYIDGETLRDRMGREGRLPLDDAIRITLEVADALAYAHAQGVIHRDIKPANILLSGRHALVADFGVAKALTSVSRDDHITQAGFIVGTIAYMSPEQAVGDADIDARSDLFSLAAVLFEMLVGEKAYAGASPQEMITRRLMEEAPSTRSIRAEVPPEVDAVIRKALAGDPSQRFATAGEFEKALGAAWRSGSFATGAIRITATPRDVPSIAVLPFENLGGNSEDEYLADGITEEILTALARRRTIRVCARVSSFAMRKAQEDVRAIAGRLGVRTVCTGTLRRAGDRLRVSAQLIDAGDGFQRWSERYDRTLADVFAIQDEIGAAIATALNATLLGESMPSAPLPAPPPIDVYEVYLRGRHLWNQRSAEGTQQAVECFRQAIARDPSYAPAHVALAEAWVTQALYGHAAPAEAMRQAREAAQAALAVDAGLADARTVLATVAAAHDWDRTGSEQVFRQAIALDPQSPAAHQGLAAMCLAPRGAFDEALQEIQQALVLDPLAPALRVTLASVHLYARDYARAIEAASAALELSAGFAPAQFFLCQAHAHQGTLARAVEHGRAAVAQSGEGSEALGALGAALAMSGDVPAAWAIADQLAAHAARGYVAPTHRAHVHAALGDTRTALDLLEEAAAARTPDLVWLGVRPAWDPLRGEPRFRALVERVGIGDATASRLRA